MAEGGSGTGGGADSDRPGDDEDPWSSITFDEDFVKGSTVTELTAAERRRAAEKDARRHRRHDRRRATAAFVRRSTLLWAAIAIVGVLGVLGARGSGPLAPVLHRTARSAAASTSSGPSPSSSTTSTTVALQHWLRPPGTCLTWDQSDSTASNRAVTAVGCDQPHLFETTGQFDLAADGYGPSGPTEAQWAPIRTERCKAPADQFLGYHLDENGRFTASALVPLPDTWRRGTHTVQCGIVAVGPKNPTAGPHVLPSFTGAVEGADQAFRYGTGTCVVGAFGTSFTVDCASPHDFEVVGTATVHLPADAAFPGDAAVDAAVNEECRGEAARTYGGPLGQGVGVGSTKIAASSWQIGQRTVECLLGRVTPDNHWAQVTGQLRR